MTSQSPAPTIAVKCSGFGPEEIDFDPFKWSDPGLNKLILLRLSGLTLVLGNKSAR
jgi:hypothetical protein